MEEKEEGQDLGESNLTLEEDDFNPNINEVNELTGTSNEGDFISCSTPTDENRPTDMVDPATDSDSNMLSTSVSYEDYSSMHVSGKAVDHKGCAKVENSKLLQRRAIKQSATINSQNLKNKIEFSEDALDGICQFHCLRCNRTYAGWDEFCCHMKKRHETTPERIDHRAFISKVVLHVCKLCSRKILCDCGFLDSHMKNKHQTSLSEYRQQYNEEWKPEVHSKKDKEIRNKVALEAGKLSMKKLGNMCEYTCPQCNIISNRFYSFAIHGKMSKKCPQEVQQNEFYKYATKVVTHQCRICSKLLACDLSMILNHVKNHGLTSIRHYSEKTGCELVGVRIRVDKETMLNLSKGAKSNSNVGNLCKFSCEKCGHSEKSWDHMKIHMRTSNHWATTGAGWSKYIVETVLHHCAICQKQLPNDKSVVVNHIKKAHALSLSSYASKCKLKILKGGIGNNCLLNHLVYSTSA